LRNQRLRQILFALKWLESNSTVSSELIFDVAAYISISLTDIFNTIDISVTAWEKKGYWVKADKFRMDWLWTINYSEKLRDAICLVSEERIPPILNYINRKLINLNVRPISLPDNFWQGYREKITKG
jgi:hypothetical protein